MSKFPDNLLYGSHSCLTDTDLITLLDGSDNSRYSKVKRLIAQGVLLHLRRGLYVLNQNLQQRSLFNSYCLAQHIYAPSYISLESALSFHRLIPEAVYTTTSVTIKRAKTFNTPMGQFSYLHLPLVNFYSQVELIQNETEKFFMAKPWKAICDYVYCYRKNWTDITPLAQSLRIDLNDLPKLSGNQFADLEDYYQHSRITKFLKGVRGNISL